MTKILLVEDESIIALSEKQTLEKNGFSVEIATSGEKALKKLDDVDIILMDINLGPGIDGIETAKQILSKKEVPIIFLSSHTEKETVERVYNVSNYGYVVKNSGEFVLIESIRMALNLFNSRQKSENDFRSLFFDNHSIMFIIDPNTGLIVKANKSAANFYGYSVDELESMNVYDINISDDNEIKEEMKLAKREKRKYFNFIHRKSDGKLTPVEVYSGPININNEEYLYSIVHDVSEKEKATKKFYNLFNKIDEGVAIYTTPDDGETFIFDDINPAGENMSKVKKSSIVGEDVKKVFPKVDSDEFNLFDVFKRVYKDGETKIYPSSFYDGPELVAWLTNKVFKLDSGEIVAIYNDVTEKKLAEDALRKSEQDLKTILDSIGDGVISVDTDKVIQSINPIAEQLIGCEESLCLGKKMDDVFHIKNTKTDEIEENPIDKVLKSGEIRYLGNHIVLESLDGETYNISDSAAPIRDIDGNITGVVFVFRDVSEQYEQYEKIKNSEKQLSKFRDRLEAVMRIGDIAWWELNLEEGSVMFNEKKASMLGYEKDDFKYYTDFINLVPQPDHDRAMEAMRDLISKKRDMYDVEYRIQHKDGHYIWFHDVGRVVEWGDEKPKKVTGVVINVTQLKEREEKFREIAKEKERLMGELNHRVKNNLAIIKSYVQIKDIETKDDLGDIISQIQSIITLHEKLYENGNIDLNFKDYISSLLNNIFSIMINNNNMNLNVDINKNIKFDSKKTLNLGLIINELATNAIKYGFDEHIDEKCRFDVSITHDKNHYVLEVLNNGNVFNEDFKIEDSEGMGLKLVETIVSDMQGEIELIKNPHTKFIIKFP